MLGDADLVLASSLTLVECERVLIRGVVTHVLPEAAAAERRGVLARTVDHWFVFDLDAEVVERARRPFPAEPIRTLDALHLATSVLARSLVPDIAVLSLDERVRRSAGEWAFVFFLMAQPEPGAATGSAERSSSERQTDAARAGVGTDQGKAQGLQRL